MSERQARELGSIVEDFVSELDAFRGFAISTEGSSTWSTILLSRAGVDVTVFYDWRVDCPEIVIGRSGVQTEKEDQIPIEIDAKQ